MLPLVALAYEWLLGELTCALIACGTTAGLGFADESLLGEPTGGALIASTFTSSTGVLVSTSTTSRDLVGCGTTAGLVFADEGLLGEPTGGALIASASTGCTGVLLSTSTSRDLVDCGTTA